MRKVLLTTICLCLLASVQAGAGVNLGLRGGILTGDDFEADDNLTLVGAECRITTIPFIHLIATGEYAWKKYDVLTSEVTFSDMFFTGSAVVPLTMPVITPYAGGGVGSHTFKLKNDDDDSSSETKMGYHIIGGVILGMPTSPLSLAAEYRHFWVDYEDDTMKFNTITGSLLFKFY